MQNTPQNGNSNNDQEKVSVVSTPVKVIFFAVLIIGLVIINQILYTDNGKNNGADLPGVASPTPTSGSGEQNVWESTIDIENLMKNMGKDPKTSIETKVELANDSIIVIPDTIFDHQKHIVQYDYTIIKGDTQTAKRITWKDDVINYGKIDSSDPIGIGVIFADKYINIESTTNRGTLFKDIDKHITEEIKEVVINPNIPINPTLYIGAIRIQGTIYDDKVMVRVILQKEDPENDSHEFSYFDVAVEHHNNTWQVADFTIHRGDDRNGIHGGY